MSAAGQWPPECPEPDELAPWLAVPAVPVPPEFGVDFEFNEPASAGLVPELVSGVSVPSVADDVEWVATTPWQ